MKDLVGASEYLVENTRQGGPEDIPPSQWRKEKKCMKKKETTTSSTKRNEGNADRLGPHEELTCATQSKRRQKPLHLKERYNRKHANCLRSAYSGSNTCWLKNHGFPIKNDSSKSSGSSASLGGCRSRSRPQWPGIPQRRPRTQQDSFIKLSLAEIACRTKDTLEKPNRESFWIEFRRFPRSRTSA